MSTITEFIDAGHNVLVVGSSDIGRFRCQRFFIQYLFNICVLQFMMFMYLNLVHIVFKGILFGNLLVNVVLNLMKKKQQSLITSAMMYQMRVMYVIMLLKLFQNYL